MKLQIVRRLIVIGVVLGLPVSAYAQQAALEATLIGRVTDTTGGVLPGVRVVAQNEATGNTFEGVSDAFGVYRIPVRVGTYRVTGQLPGFRTVIRTGLEVLVGQEVIADLQMQVSALEESVTVTGEAPLIDVTSSTVGANIDPRQMSELPINGRNWMDLSLLTPGARRNDSGGLVQHRQGYTQTNVDGQEVTVHYHSAVDGEQVGYSRDAIAEFEVIANRFDATQGRSAGMIVNAITKSGTNTFSGTVSGHFRDDTFKAADFISGRVLPYSNQQASGTFGGPILRDRLHFFAVYEYEREPKTFVYTTPYPSFNRDVEHTDQAHKPLGRVDYQFSPRSRLSVRSSGYNNRFGVGGGATSPSGNSRVHRRLATQSFATFTQVVSNRQVNEIKVGRTAYERRDQPNVRWQGRPFPHRPVLDGGSVVVELRGITIGGSPLNITQDTWTLRDDFTTSYAWGGRHDLKLGGEYMRYYNDFRWCLRCDGVIDARGGPVPPNLEALFPDTFDASTWNTAPLAPITRWVFHATSDSEFRFTVVRHLFAGWVQDDWKVNDRLTLNLGVRYDVDSDAHSEKLRFLPWLPGNLPHDTNNVAPRLGINYNLNDRTALRGGYGLFFAMAPHDGVQQSLGYTHRFEQQILNDRRPDFTTTREEFFGWFNGPKPTFQEALQNACDVNFRPGCARRSLVQEINYPGRRTPYSHQASVGLQRQLGADMSFEANYVYTGGRLEENSVNANLTYNPATGANYPFSDVSRRPFPDWGVVNFEFLEGWSNYHAGDFSFTKRFSNRWQARGTYTLAFFRDAESVRPQWFLGDNGVVARRPVGFPLTPDLGGEYTFAGTWAQGGQAATGDQRHRAVVNGIWELGYDVQLSGIYFFGSGERLRTDTGVDRRDEGPNSQQRLRADGTIVPRNAFAGDPIHRVDLRVQKRLPLAGRVTVDGIFEVFNLFNRANYGSYVTNEANRNYGQPQFSSNVAYQPRMMQVGFRFAF